MSKRLSVFFLLAFYVVGLMPVFGQAPAERVLATASFPLPANGGALQVRKFLKNDELFLEATDVKGKVLWKSEVLGSEDKLFTLPDGKVAGLAVLDVTADGVPELVAAAFYGPAASGLWIYAWKNDGFVAIPCRDSKDADSRDFLVSDAQQENGTDMLLGKNGSIEILGRIYSEKAVDEPTMGRYLFRFKNGAFELEKTEELKPPAR